MRDVFVAYSVRSLPLHFLYTCFNKQKGGGLMQQWRISFHVDNTPGDQIVSAVTADGAVTLMKKQYAGHRITIMNVMP